MDMSRSSKSMYEENKANMAALDQRVFGLEGDVQALRADLSSGLSSLRSDFGASLSSMRADFGASFNQINLKLDEKSKTPWSVIFTGLGIALSITIAIGGLAYTPIRAGMDELRLELRESKSERIREDKELAERDRRIWEFMLRMRSEFDYMRGQQSPSRQ